MSVETVKAIIKEAGTCNPKAEYPQPLCGHLAPAKPYPVEALGYILSNTALAIADIVKCPLPLAANSLLSAASLVTQAHADIIIPATGHAKPLSLFMFSVAKSGERKTTADDEALAPIIAYEEEMRRNNSGVLVSYDIKKTAWDAERARITRSKDSYEKKVAALELLGPAPEPPLFPILISPEPTFEGLCKLLPHSYPMQGIFSSEGGQFVGGHAMKEDAKLASAAGLSALWDGATIKRVRATDGISILPGRRLAMHLMIQPEAGGRFLSDPVLKDQGLASRILVGAPESTAGTRMQRESHPNSRPFLDYYKQHVLGILRTPLPLAPGTLNELRPRGLPLDDAAKKRWLAYADEVELKVKPYGEYDCISGFANKLPEHAERVAGVITVFENLQAPCITLETFENGILLAEYYASEAVRLTNTGMTSPELANASLLWDWICREWHEEYIGASVIERRGPPKLRKGQLAHTAINKLVEYKYLFEAPMGTLVEGKNVKKAWRINRLGMPENRAN
jgi:hypothetical protein